MTAVMRFGFRVVRVTTLVVGLATPALAQKKIAMVAPYVPPAGACERRSPSAMGIDSVKLADAIAYAIEKESKTPRDRIAHSRDACCGRVGTDRVTRGGAPSQHPHAESGSGGWRIGVVHHRLVGATAAAAAADVVGVARRDSSSAVIEGRVGAGEVG